MAFNNKYNKYIIQQIKLVSVTKKALNFYNRVLSQSVYNMIRYFFDTLFDTLFDIFFMNILQWYATDALKLSFFITILCILSDIYDISDTLGWVLTRNKS